MPRQKKNVTTTPTPFARILTDYMARQRPIWTTGRLARELHERRQTIGNWLYHDNLPPIDKMLGILAILNIPMAELLNAYREAGQPTPALDYESGPTTPHGRAIQAQAERAATEAEEWQQMIASTRRVMAQTGFPTAALDALLATIEASYGGRDPLTQRALEEFATPATSASNASNATTATSGQDTTSSATGRSGPTGAGSTMSPRYRNRQSGQPDHPADQGGSTGPSSSSPRASSQQPGPGGADN